MLQRKSEANYLYVNIEIKIIKRKPPKLSVNSLYDLIHYFTYYNLKH